MNQPVAMPSASPRFALPFLFAAQAQKEFFLNEALARIDALLHPQVQGTSNLAPQAAAEGECWLVGPQPEGAWSGAAGKLACHLAGSWVFVAPTDGMRVFDLATNQFLFHDGSWLRAATVTAPSGGSTVDTQARAAIAELVAALIQARIIR